MFKKTIIIVMLLFLSRLVLFLDKATAESVHMLKYTGTDTGKNEDKYTFVISLNVLTKFFTCTSLLTS